jgi:predicted  nucleic acid-binding Zn-ribbon protein
MFFIFQLIVYENNTFSVDPSLKDELISLKQKLKESQRIAENLESEYETSKRNFQQLESNFQQSNNLMRILEENDHLEKYIRGESYSSLPEQIQTYKFMAEELKYDLERCSQIREDLRREQANARETQNSYRSQIQVENKRKLEGKYSNFS